MPRPFRRVATPRAARPPAPAAATPPARVVTLDNGLTLIVREDHSAPVVSAQAWCRTGSIHEGRWLGAGLSHVLEHMLFKGTSRRTGNQIDQEVQAAGGYLNAYTSFDRTVYWINVPNTGRQVALDILADITQHATLPAEELTKELDVIRREMDMNQDDPGRRSSRRLFETAYTRSPYRFTIIGYPDIFNQLQPDDIRGYYRQRYVPNNLFFVVVGDVTTDAVVDQIRAAFAGSKAQPLAPVYIPEEPAQTAPRSLVEEAPIELGHFHFSWHIPDLRHPDVPALDILATLLGSGRSSRLYQEVRQRRGLVHSIDAWTYNPGLPGLVGVSALADADRFPAARDAILSEIDRLRDQPVPAAELRKAVKQFLAATLATRKTMQGQAQDLGGNWLAADDLGFSERYLARIQAITPQDLLRVAGQYLTPSQSTQYALLPSGTAPRSTSVTETPSESRATLWTLPNGLRVLFKAEHRLPFVDFRLVFQGGVLLESPADNGLTWLLSRMWLKGTRRRNAARIAREIESVGGTLDSYGGNNSLGLQLEVLKDDLRLGFDLLADVTLQSTFPAAELERERTVQLAGIRSQRDQLLKSAALQMRRTLFGNRGYGLDTLGTEASVPQLTAAALRKLQHRLITPANAVLAVFGDFDPGRARSEIQRRFGRWSGDACRPDASARTIDPDPTTPRRHIEDRDKKQAVIVIGYPGTDLTSPDRFALELIQEACSDLGSRLFLRIRDRLGLAYYVGAQNFTGLVPGYFAFYAGTAPNQVAQVETEILAEAALLARDGLSAEELARAKAKIIGQKKIARQDLGTQAMGMALDELYGLGFEHYAVEDAEYEKVTVDHTRAVADRYLRPDRAVISILKGPDDAATS